MVRVDDAGSGTLVVDPNLAITGGASDQLSAASSDMVLFETGTGTLDFSTLASSVGFTGEIAGFTGTAPNASDSDVIDLSGVNFNSVDFSDSYNSATGVLTVSDGTHTASLTFVDFTGSFSFAADGTGGTDIYDPPATGSVTDPSVVSTATSTATADGASGNISFAESHSGDTFIDSVTLDGANYAGSFSLDQPIDRDGHVSVGFDFMASNDQMNSGVRRDGDAVLQYQRRRRSKSGR